MGLGNRADVLEDHIDNHNFIKNMTLGATLQRRLVVARDERARQVEAFHAVSDGISPELQQQWKREIREWEDDDKRPNPFELPTKDFPTEAQIRLDLQREERQQDVEGRAFVSGGSATAFISAGIQIEDAQARIKEFTQQHSILTTDREAKLDELRLSLLRKLGRFRELQLVYMPGAAAFLAEAEMRPKCRPILLPALFKAVLLAVVDIEERLRVSQCQNALSELRFKLHGKRWLIAYRNANVTGQNQTTKAAKLLQSITQKADAISLRYKRGHSALVGLGVAQKYPAFRALKAEDVCLPADGEEKDLEAQQKLARISVTRGMRVPRNMPSSSRRVMSWIWTAPGAFDDQEEQLHTSMRVEWCRAMARKTRWNEEVMLLEEEMRRTLRYLEWQAKWWQQQAERREDVEAELKNGLQAYAYRAAAQCTQVLTHFKLKWATSERRVLDELVTLASIAELEA
ncbi:hypothetical protein MIND_01406300 [Mycena indigotica]|uniref:Uncharacterized protein n=1 Tax=Mycena indigotica TaxID=2126181 RepID=A0A8H6VSY8_9AGAR|nr:uncharacterized protein MIND_01406300 [Mycena indigotica]KAF7288903.1 hypothetical protein MIND_01406300 [Mycena indigotica]